MCKEDGACACGHDKKPRGRLSAGFDFCDIDCSVNTTQHLGALTLGSEIKEKKWFRMC